MADSSTHHDPAKPATASAREYLVVARRYRPQVFEELIGQEHIARALGNAISTHRVGHAYLFSGARGVGKTSAARILAKALNCERGPAPVPCNQCDLCLSVSSGDDVDVLEIDGASNRGIDEIRQLRQNVNVRPSRARFKIYIIDEVHMLTREAFNALLKTLEEPPEHVKFIFCTTEPTKIPITILSRCQRFDFAGILPGAIAERLRQIAESEGVEAEPEALAILARRAAGSMRDGQSLLEQLLSFASQRITVGDVHRMLGTAGEERMEALVEHLVQRNAAGALGELGAAIHEGVDPALLLEQLFAYFRDCLVALAGCPAETFLYASPASRQRVAEVGGRLGTENLLATMQILDQTLSRLRYSTQGRILAELALVRLCTLEDLTQIAALIEALESGNAPAIEGRPTGTAPAGTLARQAPAGTPGASGPKKKDDLIEPSAPGPDAPPAPNRPPIAITPENAAALWGQALAGMSGVAADQARHFDRVATLAPNRLAILFKPGYTLAKSVCERPDQLARFQQALANVVGQPVEIEFRELPSHEAASAPAAPRAASAYQRLMRAAQHPMVRLAGELLGAHPASLDESLPGASTPPPGPAGDFGSLDSDG